MIRQRLAASFLAALVAGSALAAPPSPSSATRAQAPPAVRRQAPPPSHTGPTTPLLPMKDAQRTVNVAGVTRQYILHTPRRTGRGALPLVLVLHGAGGTAHSMVQQTSFDAKADAEGFLVAYLQGTVGSANVRSWNSGLTPEFGITADDVGFVRAVVAQLVRDADADAKRIYAAGFSGGAFMCYRLGAEAADVLAGVALAEGTIGIRGDDGTWHAIPSPQAPIPILIIHGKQDPKLPYDGGQGTVSYARSVAEAVELWTRADRCTDHPRPQTSADGNVTSTDYTACSGGTEVVLDAIADGKHEWAMRPGRGGFRATDAAWTFFAGHAKK